MTPTEIRGQLASLPHRDHTRLNEYMSFIAKAPEPAQCHQHHILLKSIFPEFGSFEEHPWNRKPLSAANHLRAHYLLFRALPKQWQVYRAFVGMTTETLAGSDRYVRELAVKLQKEACDFGLMLYWERKHGSEEDIRL